MIPIPTNGQCQCQCGKLEYKVTAKPFVQYTCHCKECQKLTSGAFSLCVQYPAESVALVLGEAKLRERPTDTGNRLTTWFCADCGSALFAQNSARPKIRTVFAGTLADPSSVEVNAHIWLQTMQLTPTD